MSSSQSQPKVWFITGASSGFGRGMTECVLKKGDIAVATLRVPEVLASLKEKYPPTQLLVLRLDVSKPDEITAAFAATRSTFGRIDVVFNNAGYPILSEVETEQASEARAMFDVNFWGAVNVSTKPTILTVSAIVGMAGHPCMGYYGASKHALEGITKALAKELDPDWHIKITLIESGAFETRIKAGGSGVVLPVHPAYKDSPSKVMRYYFDNLDKMPPVGDTDKAKELDIYQDEVSQAAKYSARFAYEAGTNPFV
ncbi:hypothetical protein CPB85DRAFT_1329132 [Mucidula mucida]|nr:hypothetical protein CPB85DRAFT_1329132 [Mucidula mucida]